MAQASSGLLNVSWEWVVDLLVVVSGHADRSDGYGSGLVSLTFQSVVSEVH